jgi:hypothetical protein
VLLGQTLYLTLLSFKQGTFMSIPEPWYLWILIAKLAVGETMLRAQWSQEASLEAEIIQYGEDDEYARAYAEGGERA